MPVPVVSIMLEDVSRLFIKNIGWVEVEPSSVKVVSTLYRKAIPDTEETEYAGWGYFAIEYIVSGATNISYTTTENIIVVEVPQPEEPEGE